MALLRLLIPLLIVLSVIYVAVSIYSRGKRRSKLRAHWDRKGMTGDREAFVQRGLAKYDRSFRRKLILGVYIVPFAVIAAIIYFINYT